MPVRHNSDHTLWFKSKEDINEFDDRMIADLEISSDEYDSPYFNFVFVKSHKELLFDASLDPLIISKEIQRNIKWQRGKNDNSINRNYLHQRLYFTVVGSYFIFRELPIRNFYARSFLMYLVLTHAQPFFFRNGCDTIDHAYFQDKIYRNYDAFNEMSSFAPSNRYNKVPERFVWKTQQPAHQKTGNNFFKMPKKVVWDGTFNMPTERLVHPRYKDSRSDLIPWYNE